jgi:predicted O-methyltransferase YrrM
VTAGGSSIAELACVGNVTVLEGDWREVLPPHAPFDFVFVDGGGQETKTDPAVLGLGRRGTIFVLDDLTPGYSGPDPVRELWLDQRTARGGRDPDDADADDGDRRDVPGVEDAPTRRDRLGLQPVPRLW